MVDGSSIILFSLLFYSDISDYINIGKSLGRNECIRMYVLRLYALVAQSIANDGFRSDENTLILFTHSNKPKQPHVTCPSSVRVEIRR